jgi:hypothetical protein
VWREHVVFSKINKLSPVFFCLALRQTSYHGLFPFPVLNDNSKLSRPFYLPCSRHSKLSCPFFSFPTLNNSKLSRSFFLSPCSTTQKAITFFFPFSALNDTESYHVLFPFSALNDTASYYGLFPFLCAQRHRKLSSSFSLFPSEAAIILPKMNPPPSTQPPILSHIP